MLWKFRELIRTIKQLDIDKLPPREQRQFSKAATLQARASRAGMETRVATTLDKTISDKDLYDQYCATEERILEETSRALEIMKQLLERQKQRRKQKQS